MTDRPSNEPAKLTVFMSYAVEDRGVVLPYWDRLQASGFEPWMDCKKLLPGTAWSDAIPQALQFCDVVILFMSDTSVNKTSYVQSEMKDAMEKVKLSPEGRTTVIPVILSPCKVPRMVSRELQYVDLGLPDSWDQVLASLRVAAHQRNRAVAQGEVFGDFLVRTVRLRETWTTKIEHEFDVEYPAFSSDSKSKIAKELSTYFEGKAYEALLGFRRMSDDREDYGHSIGNSQSGGFSIHFAHGEVISVVENSHTYFSGAAHGNISMSTHNFLVSDRLLEVSLQDLFEPSEVALAAFSASCIASVTKEYWERTDEMPDESAAQWIANGAGPEWGNFDAFTVDRDGITVWFSPYQVSAYAMGVFTVTVSFFELLPWIAKDGLVPKLR